MSGFSLNGPLKEYLRSIGIQALEVTGYYDRTASTGYCETCYDFYTVIDISYRTITDTKMYTYLGDLSSLIKALEAL